MKNNVSFSIPDFCSKFADVQSKGIEQHFSQDIFFASPEETTDSPALLEYTKLTFRLNGTIQPKLLTQICCDPGLRL